MNTENDRSDVTENQPTAGVDQSRRSFAKTGASLAPVVMLLANRPAWSGANMCTQSGFASFQNGKILSNIAHVKNPGWRKPSDSVSPKQGWLQYTSWPGGFARCSRNGSSSDYSSSLWPGVKTFSQVKAYETQYNLRILMSTLFPSQCAGSLETIQDALFVQDLNSYRAASSLNNAVSTMPSYFLTANATYNDYLTFYSTCT